MKRVPTVLLLALGLSCEFSASAATPAGDDEPRAAAIKAPAAIKRPPAPADGSVKAPQTHSPKRRAVPAPDDSRSLWILDPRLGCLRGLE